MGLVGTTEAESAFLARGRKGGEHQERQKVEEYEKTKLPREEEGGGSRVKVQPDHSSPVTHVATKATN